MYTYIYTRVFCHSEPLLCLYPSLPALPSSPE